MTHKQTILFDFDGTLADTLDFVVEAYNEMAPKVACLPVQKKDLEKLRDQNLRDLMKQHKIGPFKLAWLALRIRRKLKKNMQSIQPIKDIQQVLESLEANGYQLAILSSNSQANVQAFLAQNHWENFFQFVETSRRIFAKHTALAKLLKQKDLSPAKVLYVGDETRDIEAAHKVGIKVVAVTWGYNGKKALSELKPEELAEEPKGLIAAIEKAFHSKRKDQ